MDASTSQIEVLLQLGSLDQAGAAAKRELDALSHPKAIHEVRLQRSEVLKKKAQVQDMLDAAEEELDNYVQEDEKLAEKQAESSAELEGAADFRQANARSKELEGIVKRRDKIAFQLGRLQESIDKTRPVMDTIMKTLAVLDSKEAQLVSEYKEVGGALKRKVDASAAQRDALLAQLPANLRKAYELALEKGGGVALARLEGTGCSVCRNHYEPGRMVQIKQEAPLSTCPHCRRILVVEEQ